MQKGSAWVSSTNQKSLMSEVNIWDWNKVSLPAGTVRSEFGIPHVPFDIFCISLGNQAVNIQHINRNLCQSVL